MNMHPRIQHRRAEVLVSHYPAAVDLLELTRRLAEMPTEEQPEGPDPS